MVITNRSDVTLASRANMLSSIFGRLFSGRLQRSAMKHKVSLESLVHYCWLLYYLHAVDSELAAINQY